MIKDVKYKVNEKQFYGLLLKGGLISWETLISYGGLKDDQRKLIFQPLNTIDCMILISLNMLSWSGNQKEGKEKELFDNKYVSLIEDPNDLHALKFVNFKKWEFNVILMKM
mgnify:CR=1 FL=1